MRPVFQTSFGSRGNCMQAAAASMLELPIASVPDFGNMPGDSFARMRKFFEAFGFDLLDRAADAEPAGLYFETGISTQGHEHIVIARGGALVHDPNPHGLGLIRRDGVLVPKPLVLSAKPLVERQRPTIAGDAALTEQRLTVLRPIQPNEGVRAWYREQLVALARRMADDILAKLKRAYPAVAERMSTAASAAMDDDPIVTLRTVLRIWGRLWQKRFDDMAKDIATLFVDKSQRHLDTAMRQRLKEAGFTVRFRPTQRMVSAYRAAIAENVNLIRSIPQQFLKDVQSQVWTAAMNGGSMGQLSTQIRRKYGLTYRRAAFIARDQVNKSKAVLERARRADLGITEADWVHSHAGKQPRPTHLAMHGKRFKIADGMYDSAVGRKVQPGEEPNCRCTSRAVLPERVAKSP